MNAEKSSASKGFVRSGSVKEMRTALPRVSSLDVIKILFDAGFAKLMTLRALESNAQRMQTALISTPALKTAAQTKTPVNFRRSMAAAQQTNNAMMAWNAPWTAVNKEPVPLCLKIISAARPTTTAVMAIPVRKISA